jgi:hypothetical protein
MTQVQNLNSFKEKQTADFYQQKEKIEAMLKSIGSQLEQSEKGAKNYINKMLDTSETNFRNEIEQLNKRITDMRLENHKYAFELQKSANELNVEHEKMLNMKKETLSSLDNSVTKMENMHKETVKELDEYKNEFGKIKSRFIELAEFIKDIRFKRNAGIDTDKKELRHFANRMAFQEVPIAKNEKRHSTLIAKYPTINDLDRAVGDVDTDERARIYLGGNSQRGGDIIFNNLDQPEGGIILEAEDGHETTLPNEEKEKSKSGADFYSADTKRMREFESERLNNRFKSKLPDSSRRHDTTNTRDANSPVRGHGGSDTANPPNKKIHNEIDKRTYELEKRIIEIEHNAKKKLEELTAQLKIYIPSINFNPYVKSKLDKADKNLEKLEKLPQLGTQLNVENLIYNNNTGQNFASMVESAANMINNAVMMSATGTKKFVPVQKPSTVGVPKDTGTLNINGLHTNRDYYPSTAHHIKNESKSTSKSVR